MLLNISVKRFIDHQKYYIKHSVILQKLYQFTSGSLENPTTLWDLIKTKLKKL